MKNLVKPLVIALLVASPVLSYADSDAPPVDVPVPEAEHSVTERIVEFGGKAGEFVADKANKHIKDRAVSGWNKIFNKDTKYKAVLEENHAMKIREYELMHEISNLQAINEARELINPSPDDFLRTLANEFCGQIME